MSSARLQKPAHRFRADIQGLRAVAVALVVLAHFTNRPAGGYIGVDVFYVISGFLITSLLLKERHATGRISLTGFYMRRARRILPAAVLTALATIAAAFALWFLPRAMQTLLDGVAALLFVENWHLVRTGADYLDASAAPSPFQHYWSLSVEEQFYAVWPLLLIGILALIVRARMPRLLAPAIAALLALSIAYAAYRTSAEPIPAYFDAGARAWELLAGALVAAVGPASDRLSARLRSLVSAAGLAAIVASAFVLDGGSPMSFPGGVAPVLGALAVVWARTDAATPLDRVLDNPVAQYIGKISYSLYLWHFPVAVFATSLGVPWPVALAAAVALSALSYHLVEGRWISSAGRVRTPFAGRLRASFAGRLRTPLAGRLRTPLAGRLRTPKAPAMETATPRPTRWSTARLRRAMETTVLPAVVLLALTSLTLLQLTGPSAVAIAHPWHGSDSSAGRLRAPQASAIETAPTPLADIRTALTDATTAATWPASVRAQLDGAAEYAPAMGKCLNHAAAPDPKICDYPPLAPPRRRPFPAGRLRRAAARWRPRPPRPPAGRLRRTAARWRPPRASSSSSATRWR